MQPSGRNHDRRALKQRAKALDAHYVISLLS